MGDTPIRLGVVGKGGGGGPHTKREAAESGFAEHLKKVSAEERNRLADWLIGCKLETYADFVHITKTLAAEVIRGSMSAETATAVRLMIESSFMALAASESAKAKSTAAGVMNTLADIVKRAKEDARNIHADYTSAKAITETVDIEVGTSPLELIRRERATGPSMPYEDIKASSLNIIEVGDSVLLAHPPAGRDGAGT